MPLAALSTRKVSQEMLDSPMYNPTPRKLKGLFTVDEQEANIIQSQVAFYDTEKVGGIDVRTACNILAKIVREPLSEEILVKLATEHNIDQSYMKASDCIRMVEIVRSVQEEAELLEEIEDTWLSMGGAADRSGYVPVDSVRKALRDFGMHKEMEEFVNSLTSSYDEGKLEGIPFDSFRTLMAETSV